MSVEGEIISRQDIDQSKNTDIMKKFSLKPIIYLMSISACFNCSKGGIHKCLLYIYKGFLIACFLVYILRIVIFMKASSFDIITSSLLTCECFGSCLGCWKAFSMKHGHFHDSMDLWHKTTSKMITQGIPLDFRHFRRGQAIIVSIAIVLTLVSVSLQFVVAFVLMPSQADLAELGYNISFTAPFPDTPASRILVTIPVCVQVVPLITPAFCLMVISFMLHTGFRGYNNHLKKVLRRGRENSFEHLEYCRQVHVDLCQAVSDLDKDLRFLYGNIYLWTLGLSIVVLYSIVKIEQSMIGILVSLFFLVLTLGMLFSMSVSAAYVHEEAHAPLDTIYYVNVETISLEKATQLNLFLSKLTGTQVGFTTFGLLTITKEFILTIAGVFLTYFAVLYTTV